MPGAAPPAPPAPPPAAPAPSPFRDAAAADNKQAPLHRWVPWIAGYSAGFVRSVFDELLPARGPGEATVLDPFAGVGTTLVEAQLRGWHPVGFEINGYAALACRAKLGAASIDPDALAAAVAGFRARLGAIEAALDAGRPVPAPRTAPPAGFRTRIPFFPARVLPKVLHALDLADELAPALRDLVRLAFAATMVSLSNYTYEPSLGSRPGAGKPLLEDAPVTETIAAKLEAMLEDVRAAQGRAVPWALHERSIMGAREVLAPASVDLLVTSPPYLNNYHYVRNTRPQMYWLGLAASPRDLRRLEEENFGTFWQVVREQAAIPLAFAMPEIEERLALLRSLRTEKGIYGGTGWANYAATYYNDTHRFLGVVAQLLKPGGAAVVVVGNSLLQGVELKVEEHVGAIGALHGLECEAIHTVRETRVGTSIVSTGARETAQVPVRLYDAATVLRRPA